MPVPGTDNQAVTAAHFYLDFPNLGTIAFSELVGINSTVVPQEYLYNNDQGNTVQAKQFGRAKPPTVTVRRGVDADSVAKLMAWHNTNVLDGSPLARGNGTIKMMDGSGQTLIVYALMNAWCSKITISAAAVEFEVTCERITTR